MKKYKVMLTLTSVVGYEVEAKNYLAAEAQVALSNIDFKSVIENLEITGVEITLIEDED